MKKHLIFVLTLALLASGCGGSSVSDEYHLYAETVIAYVDAYFDETFSAERACDAMTSAMEYSKFLPEYTTQSEENIWVLAIACDAYLSAINRKLLVNEDSAAKKIANNLLEDRNQLAKIIDADERKTKDTFK